MGVELIRAGLEHNRYLYELYARPDVMAAHGRTVPIAAVDWRRILQGVWEGWKDVWVVVRDGSPIGHVGLHDRADTDRRADVAITIDPSCREQGAGREALGRLIAYCEAEGIETLFARVRFGNEPSLALFSSFGFREVGRLPRYYRTGEGVFSQLILARTLGATPATEPPETPRVTKTVRTARRKAPKNKPAARPKRRTRS